MENIRSTATLTADTIFSWQHQDLGIHCQCRLRIYQLEFDRVLVIASNRNNYPGAFNTDDLKHLIHRVQERFSLAINKTMWIEHYVTKHSERLEFFYQILLVWNEVRSYKIGQHQLEWFLGQRI